MKPRPKQIPLQLLVFIYPGTHRDWWRKCANDGRLGPVTVEPGSTVRNRMVDTATVESCFGAVSDEQYAEAVRQYENARRLVRRVS